MISHSKTIFIPFDKIDFKDKRLNKRFDIIYDAFSQNPKAIISEVINNYHQCKAAYRFFANSKVTKDKFLQAHHKFVKEMIKDESIILEIQDTTNLDLTSKRKTEGKGDIGTKKNKRKGFVCHNSLIVTGDGTPIGIGSLDLIIINNFKDDSKYKRQIKLEDKESIKWLNAVSNFDQAVESQKRIIITDREGDFYEFFDFIHENNQDMIIRANANRKTSENELMKDVVKKMSIIGETKIEIKSKGSGKTQARAEQTVEIEARFSTQTILAPKNLPKKYITNRSLKLTLIHVVEKYPREGEELIEWYLLTTLPITTKEEVLQIIKWYSFRWLVEEFHKILKAGIKIEEARLQTGDRLEALISFLAPIACRLLYMTYFHRVQPEASSSLILNDLEIDFLILKFGKGQKDKPTIRQAIHWIANLGGFLGRKSDKHPGLLTLWRGWIKFCDMLKAVQLLTENIEFLARKRCG